LIPKALSINTLYVLITLLHLLLFALAFLANFLFLSYGYSMTISQTVEIPANSRTITVEVPREIPSGSVILTFTSAPVESAEKASDELSKERKFGCAKGKYRMADDFDAPLDDFKDYM